MNGNDNAQLAGHLLHEYVSINPSRSARSRAARYLRGQLKDADVRVSPLSAETQALHDVYAVGNARTLTQSVREAAEDAALTVRGLGAHRDLLCRLCVGTLVFTSIQLVVLSTT